MTTEELYDKLKLIQKMKCETQNLELKSAEQGYPEYSRAVTPQIRQTGNRLSGNAGTAYASLLA